MVTKTDKVGVFFIGKLDFKNMLIYY